MCDGREKEEKSHLGFCFNKLAGIDDFQVM